MSVRLLYGYILILFLFSNIRSVLDGKKIANTEPSVPESSPAWPDRPVCHGGPCETELGVLISPVGVATA